MRKRGRLRSTRGLFLTSSDLEVLVVLASDPRVHSYLRILEEKVKAYEGAPDTVTRNRAVAGPSRRGTGEDYVNDEEIEDEHPLLEPFNQLTVDRLSTSTCAAFAPLVFS
jgi:hypothetical protein